jgi:hypothetical protein
VVKAVSPNTTSRRDRPRRCGVGEARYHGAREISRVFPTRFADVERLHAVRGVEHEDEVSPSPAGGAVFAH